jgi:flagellin
MDFMALTIGTNVASLAAQRQIGITTRETGKAMQQLGSGSRFAAGDDAADFAISEHLRGQIRSMKAAQMNADNAISFVQVAEGGLNEQNNILIRMRELAIQAASDTIGDTEREFVNKEFTQISSELDRIAKTTRFGTHHLLSGEGKEFEFQVGADKGPDNVVKYNSETNTTASALEIDGLSVAEQGDAEDSLETIDAALTKVAGARASFGAIQSRLQSVSDNSLTQIENLTAAHSRMADTDVAEAVAKMTHGRIKTEFQAAVLAQANQLPSLAMKLIS